MMGRTHILVGISSVWLLALIPNVVTPETLTPLAVCAALGALLPDLDANRSTISHLSVAHIQPFAPISSVLSRDWGHRGMTHSLIGLAAFAVLVSPIALFWSWPIWAVLCLGYVSHLAADACTRSGIPLHYPNKRRFHLLPLRWRFRTGSLAEDALTPLVALLVLLLLLSLLPQPQN